jgi:DNA-binding transcriptional LysR family regulator
MRRINLDYLRTFVTVTERGSFSAAADLLNLTQPAVSQQIRQLERSLGAPLIERVGRKARPTAAGAELLAHAGRIDDAVAAAIDAVARQADGTRGRVRLGTGATACIFLLPPMLKELRRKFPDLEITVTTGNTNEVVKAIEDNVLDIGLVTLPVSGRALDITHVLDEELVVIAPPDMPLPARVTPQALATRPVLLFEPGGNKRRLIDQWLARGGVSLKPAMSLGSVEGIKELVAAGLGCAILPAMAVRDIRQHKNLSLRPLAPRLQRQLAVVIRRDKRLTAALKAVFVALKRIG